MDYLPRGEGNTKSFGGIEVTIKQISKKADYVLTTLSVADSKVHCNHVDLFKNFIEKSLSVKYFSTCSPKTGLLEIKNSKVITPLVSHS